MHRPGLACHEDKDGIGLPFLEFHLGDSRAHAPDIPRERIGRHVLAGTVELEVFCNPGAFQENIPREPVDRFAVHPAGMGHNQFEIIAAVGDK